MYSWLRSSLCEFFGGLQSHPNGAVYSTGLGFHIRILNHGHCLMKLRIEGFTYRVNPLEAEFGQYVDKTLVR